MLRHMRPCFCLLEASLFLPVRSVTDAVHTIRLEHSLLLPYCFNQGQAQQCIKHTHEANGMQHGMRVYILCMSPSLCCRRHVHSSCQSGTLRGIWLQVCMYTCIYMPRIFHWMLYSLLTCEILLIPRSSVMLRSRPHSNSNRHASSFSIKASTAALLGTPAQDCTCCFF